MNSKKDERKMSRRDLKLMSPRMPSLKKTMLLPQRPLSGDSVGSSENLRPRRSSWIDHRNIQKKSSANSIVTTKAYFGDHNLDIDRSKLGLNQKAPTIERRNKSLFSPLKKNKLPPLNSESEPSAPSKFLRSKSMARLPNYIEKYGPCYLSLK